MRARRRRTATAIGWAVAATLAAAPAGASVDGFVAAGPNGIAHFAWWDGSPNPQIFERRLGSNGALSTAQMASPAYRPASGQAVGVDAAGNALIAWHGSEGEINALLTRRRAPDGSLGAVQRVSPAGVHIQGSRLAVEPDGDAIYVWERDIGDYAVVQARRRAASGTLGPILTLSYALAHAYAPDVAVTPAGTATAAWLRSDSEGNVHVQARAIAPGGALSPTRNLTAPNQTTEEPHVTVSDAGTAVVAWLRAAAPGAGYAVQSRIRRADGTLGVTQTISAPNASYLRTAGDGTGRTAYTYTEAAGEGVWTLKARIRQPDGGLGPAFTVTSESGVAPRVAMDPDGNATFAWQVGQALDSSVHGRRRSVGGILGPARTLSTEGTTAISPHVAVDAAGKATVVFFVTGEHFVFRTITAGGTVSPLRALRDE